MDVDKVFKALGDPYRIVILRLMIEENQSLCVCELVTILGLPQYQVSRHLAILKKMDLVQVQKIGTWAYYSFNGSTPFNLLLSDFIKKVISKNELSEVFRKMENRLDLRYNGRCVVGFEHETKILGSPIHIPSGILRTKRKK